MKEERFNTQTDRQEITQTKNEKIKNKSELLVNFAQTGHPTTRK